MHRVLETSAVEPDGTLEHLPAQLSDEISRGISEFYNNTVSHSMPNFGRKSGMWSRPGKFNFRQKMLDEPLEQALRYVQNLQQLNMAQSVDSLEAGLCASELVNDLQTLGFNLHDAPTYVKEAGFTAPEQVLHYGDRPVSVDFLYRLNICRRIGDVLQSQGATILEIGAGQGNLARTVKLLNPSVKYVIIDLLDTLLVSYGFLRASFPDASVTTVLNSAELSDLRIDTDFTFIPAEVVPTKAGEDDLAGHDIPHLNFHLAVNNQSLGEMRQDIAEDYIELIQNRLNVNRFYSLNHFLDHEESIGRWRDESVVSSYCTPLDPYWQVLRWEYSVPFVGHCRAGNQEGTLELYVQRVDPSSVTEETLLERSDEKFAEAQSLGDFRGHLWHRLMWESVQLCPRPENVEAYYQFLSSTHRRQARYFGRMLAGWGVPIDGPHTIPELPAKPLLRRSLRQLSAGALRRLASVINPPRPPSPANDQQPPSL